MMMMRKMLKKEISLYFFSIEFFSFVMIVVVVDNKHVQYFDSLIGRYWMWLLWCEIHFFSPHVDDQHPYHHPYRHHLEYYDMFSSFFSFYSHSSEVDPIMLHHSI